MRDLQHRISVQHHVNWSLIGYISGKASEEGQKES